MWRVVLSAMAAAFGVQSQKNLENDERSRSIVPYVIAGVILTALFVVSLVTAVNLIL